MSRKKNMIILLTNILNCNCARSKGYLVLNILDYVLSADCGNQLICPKLNLIKFEEEGLGEWKK